MTTIYLTSYIYVQELLENPHICVDIVPCDGMAFHLGYIHASRAVFLG